MVKTTKSQNKLLFEKDDLRAVDALSRAQFIAFAPYVFQASVLLRDRGILTIVEESRSKGVTVADVAEKVNMSDYAARVLMEAGLGIGLLYCSEDRYFLAKTGHFYLNDPMTKINTDFMRDVCHDGAQDLGASLDNGKPEGLKQLGPWQTIYQGLSIMQEPARTSWFNFDHFYSDNAFPTALSIMFGHKPKKVLDIGANTGKFSLACLAHDADVEVGLVDLQVQLNVARKNIEEAGYENRVQYYDCDMLDAKSELPKGYDIIWMSQFLDCFSEQQVVDILTKCHGALDEHGRIFINETFWDRQRFEASAFSLQMTSLYFTTMANGNSQMYAYHLFENLIHNAGFDVVGITDNVGHTHTVLELVKK